MPEFEAEESRETLIAREVTVFTGKFAVGFNLGLIPGASDQVLMAQCGIA